MKLSQIGVVDPISGKPYQGDPTISSQTSSWAAAVTFGGVAVGLAQSFYSSTTSFQSIGLVHELLHLTFGGASDVENAARFGLSYDTSLTGDALRAAAGNAMNDWLRKDCGSGK